MQKVSVNFLHFVIEANWFGFSERKKHFLDKPCLLIKICWIIISEWSVIKVNKNKCFAKTTKANVAQPICYNSRRLVCNVLFEHDIWYDDAWEFTLYDVSLVDMASGALVKGTFINYVKVFRSSLIFLIFWKYLFNNLKL